MNEGTWRVCENADGTYALYLFRSQGGYVWIELDAEDGGVVLKSDKKGASTFHDLSDWQELAPRLLAFLQATE